MKRLIHTVILLLNAFVIMVVATLAWFAQNIQTSHSSPKINVQADLSFELASEGAFGQFSQGTYTASLGLQREAGEYIELPNGTGVFATSSETPSVEWMVHSSSHIQNELLPSTPDEYYPKLQPGMKGSISFWILPTEENTEETEIPLKLSLIPYVPSEGETPYEVMDEAHPVADLLKGHILFFREYEDGQYADWIHDGTFSVRMEDSTPKKVTLYWVWPLYYSSIKGTVNPICGNATDQALLLADVAANPSKYFAFLGGTIPEDFELDENNQYHSANYNRADERIGLNIPYIVAEVSFN